MKQKWKNTAQIRSIEYLSEIMEILNPFLKHNGTIKLSNEFEQKVAILIALLLNCEFSLSENNESQFGIDDVQPILMKKENNTIKYFGKIYWLSTPKDYNCFKSYQDPFYGEFAIKNDSLHVEVMKFGDFDVIDLDSDSWIDNKIDWKYKVQNETNYRISQQTS